MGDFVFNGVKGTAGYWSTLPAASDGLILVLLQASGLETDDVLSAYDTLSALLAASNDEATFTNYGRKTITAVTDTVTDASRRQDYDFADQTWVSAGGATNNDLGKLLVCYDPNTGSGTDTTVVPLSAHDFVITTDGSDIDLSLNVLGFLGYVEVV